MKILHTVLPKLHYLGYCKITVKTSVKVINFPERRVVFSSLYSFIHFNMKLLFCFVLAVAALKVKCDDVPASPGKLIVKND